MNINERHDHLFVCPDCKTALTALHCATCGAQFEDAGGVPHLLSRDARFTSINDFGTTYDEIYSHRTGVWEDQGRTPEFIRYFSDLAARLSTGSLLEVGCGEGFLLRELRAAEKVAIDISATAVRQAMGRVGATFCVAAAERLPFADNRFDLVVSVGVMEHFLDDAEATGEIWRVLRPGGHYLALIHTELTYSQRVGQKVREYFFPRLRLGSFAGWVASKIYRPVHQPIQRKYTKAAARGCLERSGLAVDEVVSLSSHPDAPLVGPHVVIYVARRPVATR